MITVTATDSLSNVHDAEGCFRVVEPGSGEKLDLWLYSSDIEFSDEDPNLGDTITIDATVHARSDNTDSTYDVPVTFHAHHGSGESYQIGSTQQIEEMPPGGDWLLSTSWTNAAEGGYIIEVELGPGYSDDRNYNNRATRAIIVGKHPFLIGGFVVWRKIRESRTEFKYVCKVILENISSVTVEDVQLELLEVSSNMTIIDGNVTFGYIEAGESAAGDDTCVFDVNRAEPNRL